VGEAVKNAGLERSSDQTGRKGTGVSKRQGNWKGGGLSIWGVQKMNGKKGEYKNDGVKTKFCFRTIKRINHKVGERHVDCQKTNSARRVG